MHVFSARKAIPGRIPPGPLPLAVSRSLQASPPAGALIVPDRANRLSTGGEARAPPAPPWPWSKEQFELDALNKDNALGVAVFGIDPDQAGEVLFLGWRRVSA